MLSEPDAEWSGRAGYVCEALLADYPNLSALGSDMSGPPARVHASQGIPRRRRHRGPPARRLVRLRPGHPAGGPAATRLSSRQSSGHPRSGPPVGRTRARGAGHGRKRTVSKPPIDL